MNRLARAHLPCTVTPPALGGARGRRAAEDRGTEGAEHSGGGEEGRRASVCLGVRVCRGEVSDFGVSGDVVAVVWA